MSGWVDFPVPIDITPIALADKVLVHFVLPRCKVVSVEFLGEKSASHLSVNVNQLVWHELSSSSSFDMKFAHCCYSDRPVLCE